MIQKKIVLTGNHHTPAIEVIKSLKLDKNISWKIHYFSQITPTDSHITKTIIPELKVTFHNIPCGKFDRRFPLKTIIGFPLIIAGFFKSFFLLQKIKPDLLVSFGGYVSVPPTIASWFLNIPSITHEQTLTISLATKINSYFANKVALSFAETKNIGQLPVGKIIVTGNILRREIFENSSKIFKPFEKSISKFPLIYITGGSQGSQFINQIILKSLPKLKNYTLIHQTGTAYFNQIKELSTPIKHPHYHPVEYISLSDIGWIFNHSSLIISRSGANTCQELAALHKKSILIPYPYAQQNEQQLNAQWLYTQSPQSTVILLQSELTSPKLISSINSLMSQQIPGQNPQKPTIHPLVNLIHEMV